MGAETDRFRRAEHEAIDLPARDFQRGDWIAPGGRVAAIESVKVGRVRVTLQLVGRRTPLRLQVDEVWTVNRRKPSGAR